MTKLDTHGSVFLYIFFIFFFKDKIVPWGEGKVNEFWTFHSWLPLRTASLALLEYKTEFIKNVDLTIESEEENDDDLNDKTPPVKPLPGFSNSSPANKCDDSTWKENNPYYLV